MAWHTGISLNKPFCNDETKYRYSNEDMVKVVLRTRTLIFAVCVTGVSAADREIKRFLYLSSKHWTGSSVPAVAMSLP